MTGQNGFCKELRIALVCYGGVSLAVYMHGVTKEIFKLVRAARAFDAALDADPTLDTVADPFAEPAGQAAGGPEYDTERTYFAALVALARAGTPVTALVDLVAGTSAGGINGVCLARAITQGRSLNGFRSLWIDMGDLKILLEGHGLGFTHEQRMVSKLAVACAELVRHPGETSAPLKGALMSRLLYSALRDMKAVTGQGPTLVRPDSSLDLFVTTTDLYGYETAIPTGTGGVSHLDHSYRQLLGFRYEPGGTDDFGDDGVAALAFSARATASFPGAFPPVSLETFASAIRDVSPTADADLGSVPAHFCFGSPDGQPAGSWYIDGGVLDNGPFDHVIDAIAAKPAATETAREILYIEPDPVLPPAAAAGPAPQPTWFKTVWASRASIPQHEPLVGTLGQLRDMNELIAEVGRIAELQMSEVLPLLDDSGTDSSADYAAMLMTAEQVRRKAKEASGLEYATYCRLKAAAVADPVAAAVARHFSYPERSNEEYFVAAVLGAWVRSQHAWLDGNPATLERVLGAVDLPFRVRRSQFILQGINVLFAEADRREVPPRQDLATLKAACWRMLTDVHEMAPRALAAVGGELAVLGPLAISDDIAVTDPQEYAQAHDAELAALFAAYSAQLRQLSVGSSRGFWESFRAVTGHWDSRTRSALACRYLAFPIWDALIFPIIALARLPQLTPIGVTRFSPLDASRLTPVDENGSALPHKLRGTALAHFGGFFDKEWRENDYLWGRLDGAELVLRLLSRAAGGADLAGQLDEALTAILATESQPLGLMRGVMARLAAQVRAGS